MKNNADNGVGYGPCYDVINYIAALMTFIVEKRRKADTTTTASTKGTGWVGITRLNIKHGEASISKWQARTV